MAGSLPPFYARLRFATATISAWLLNLNAFGGSLKSVCSPGFNCHGCPWATAACPIGALTYGSAVHAIPVLALGSMLAVGVVLGRLACGFLCPFGFLQDLLHRIPGPKVVLPRWFRYGKYVALALLVFVLPWALGFEQSGYLRLGKPVVNKSGEEYLSVRMTVTNMGMEPLHGVQIVSRYRSLADKTELPARSNDFKNVTVGPGQTLELPAFLVPNRLSHAELLVDSPQCTVRQTPRYQLYFCKLCPSGTLTAAIPLYFMRGAEGGKSFLAWAAGIRLRLVILALFLIAMVIGSRPFCRLACPMGAVYALTARLAILRMRMDPTACVDCGICDKACPLGLDVRREVGGMECIACGDCKVACPKAGIVRTFGI